MQVRFTLAMDDVTVEGRLVDCVVLDWTEEMDYDQLLSVYHNWISSQNFLTRRMTGLTRVGESSLTIEPLDEF